MITVVLQVAGPPELGDRLAQLAADGTEVTLATPFGMFSAGVRGDDMLFIAANLALLRYLKGADGQGVGSRETTRYWLRCAADEARRATRERS